MPDQPKERKEQNQQRTPVPSFKDVYQRGYAFSGKRVKLEDVQGKEILIREFVKRPSKFEDGREMVVVHAYNRQVNPQEPYDFSFATGSKVIIQQLERTKNRLPYKATVTKVKNYFSLV